MRWWIVILLEIFLRIPCPLKGVVVAVYRRMILLLTDLNRPESATYSFPVDF